MSHLQVDSAALKLTDSLRVGWTDGN